MIDETNISEKYEHTFDRTHLVREFKLLYKKTKEYLNSNNLINGISNSDDKSYFINLLLTRFLFLWFLQKKEGKLLDNDDNYLINKFKQYSPNFYKNFLNEFFSTSLCYKDSDSNKSKLISKIGRVPYLNSSLFLKSKVEESYPIEISDEAFYIDDNSTTYGLKNIKTYNGSYPIFNVFESRDWSNLSDKVLGDIFEELMNTNERKETGAYYTPSVITKYMSKNTIEPYLLNILEEKGFKFSSLDELFNNYNEKAGEILFEHLKKITIVDNACGSGHYLVDASEYLVSIWNNLREKNFSGVIRLMSKEGDILDKEICNCSDKDFAYHIIVNNIYGVDINKEAIEIAKLRLFLFIADKFENIDDVIPLPNIAFNIEYGNSLIGFTEVENIYTLRNSKFDNFAVNKIIENYPNLKEDKFISPYLEKLKYFENTMDNPRNFFKIRNDLINIFKNLHNPSDAINLRDFIVDLTKYFNDKLNHIFLTSYLDKTGITLDKLEVKEPFHWVMRFSEVFEKGGFDIVIGNPPYVRQELIRNEKPYLEKIYAEIYDGISDLSTYFVYRSLQILKVKGIHSYIITNKWLRANYGYNIRNYLRNNTNILQLLDFNETKVFVGATVDVIIYFISKEKKINTNIKTCNNFDNLKHIFKLDDMNSLNKIINKNSFEISQKDLGENSWNLIDSRLLEINNIIEKKGVRLKRWDIEINRGILTGMDKVFIIDEVKKDELIKLDKKNKNIIKKTIRGKNIGKYFFEDNKRYLINTHNGLKKSNIPKVNVEKDYPFIYDYLNKYKEKLSERTDKGDTPYNLRNCSYLNEFEKSKIIFSRIVKKPQFYLDNSYFYGEATTYILTGKINLKYLLLLLNSNFVYNTFYIFYSGGGVNGEIKIVKLKEYPIIKLNNTKPFEVIADYLLFTNQWLHENEKNQTKEFFKIREISQFFDEVANALVYELYLKEELEKDNLYYNLLEEIQIRLEEIDFDNWSKELFRDEEDKDIDKLKNIENNNIKTLFNVYENLDVKNILTDIEEMKTNEYINIIEKST